MNTSRLIKAFPFCVIISTSIGDITFEAVEMNTNGFCKTSNTLALIVNGMAFIRGFTAM